MADMTITGTPEQIVDALAELAICCSPRRRSRVRNEIVRQEIIAARRIVHAALMRARQRDDVDAIKQFVGALCHRLSLDSDFIRSASRY